MDRMTVEIRIAGAADAEAIAAIYRPYVENSRISFEDAAPDAADMVRRIVGDMPGLYPWLVAEGKPLGMPQARHSGPVVLIAGALRRGCTFRPTPAAGALGGNC